MLAINSEQYDTVSEYKTKFETKREMNLLIHYSLVVEYIYIVVAHRG